MRIALTGSRGQVATALQEQAARGGHEVVCLARPEFDLARPGSAYELLAKVRPDILVSAAAYTAVDLAETQRDDAFLVNADGPGVLAQASARLDIPVLHLSTDYVFDGLKKIPYVENDPAGPRSVYGASKLAGEIAVAAANPRHVILRTAWVYSHEGKNFLRTMLRLAQNNPVVRVVSDQFGCPTYATDIANTLLEVARQTVGQKQSFGGFGTFHMASSGDTSWAGFAQAIFAIARAENRPSAQVVGIATADYPTPATRPENSRLNCQKLHECFGLTLPHWYDGTNRCISRIRDEI